MNKPLTGKAAPVAVVLAFFLQAAVPALAQVCDSDGVPVEFRRLKAGSLVLKDARTGELVGKNRSDQSYRIAASQILSTYYRDGALRVEQRSVTADLVNGPVSASLDRKLANIWEVNFPRGLYEFRRKSDLRIDLFATVASGEAVHISEGPVSSVELQVSEGKIREVWWKGGTSLRRLRGDLEFVYSNLGTLARAGEHRATVNLCVNIRGHL